jgi:hypothetical protein
MLRCPKRSPAAEPPLPPVVGAGVHRCGNKSSRGDSGASGLRATTENQTAVPTQRRHHRHPLAPAFGRCPPRASSPQLHEDYEHQAAAAHQPPPPRASQPPPTPPWSWPGDHPRWLPGQLLAGRCAGARSTIGAHSAGGCRGGTGQMRLEVRPRPRRPSMGGLYRRWADAFSQVESQR